MGYSKFLESRKDLAHKLVAELRKDFEYVSILGSDVNGDEVSANYMATSVNDVFDSDKGFVIKLYNGQGYAEYSCGDLDKDVVSFAKHIKENIKLTSKLSSQMVKVIKMEDKPYKERFIRENEGREVSMDEKVKFAKNGVETLKKADKRMVNAIARISEFCVSKMFITEHKELEQYYTWTNTYYDAFMRNEEGKMAVERVGSCYNNTEKAMKEIESKIPELLEICEHVLASSHVVPGEYECVIDPEAAGLIAHEAFGHGVEMDQFVKNRALAKKYINDYVASPIISMHDGAASYHSVASYFFDDDGVLAHDTEIIDHGILKRGISDYLSALELGTEPTGNGRRESSKRKAYTRMTNTYFVPADENKTSTVEEMIKSIKHGYFLHGTNNGMEDPKNWNIQCVVEWGQEIVDGKLTNNFISPVVMSGYVPDLLKSISMISKKDSLVVTGAGMCGKGYKEWVRVSDGGCYMKAKVKIA